MDGPTTGSGVTRRTLLRAAGGSVLLGTAGCSGRTSGREQTEPPSGDTTAPPTTSVRDRPDDGTMRFVVEVPTNTPDTARVFVYTNDGQKHEMERVDAYVHRIALDGAAIGVADETSGEIVAPVRYRYDLNGLEFATAEYLDPDTEGFFWGALGRQVPFEPGTVRRDVVTRWRWWPPDDVPIRRTTDLPVPTRFRDRVDGEPFHAGQVMEDLYLDAFRPHFDDTAAHVADVGYSTVLLAPPWQWVRADPPVVGNGLALDVYDVPNYPDDRTLAAHVEAFKRAGLRVLLAPQVCCVGIDTIGRTRDWWAAYFDELERFAVHHATVAADTGVDGFVSPDAMPPASAPVDTAWIEARWRRLFGAIREVYDRPLGHGIDSFVEDDGTPGVLPEAVDLTWADALDFVLMGIDAPISLADRPTDADLVAGAGAILDPTRAIYDRYGTPTVAMSQYFAVQGSWKGSAFYDIGSVPTTTGSESAPAAKGYTLSTADQARTLHAFMAAIGERPWITGFLQFGYTHWEYPLAPDLSVRGEPAEDLWGRWNRRLRADGSLR